MIYYIVEPNSIPFPPAKNNSKGIVSNMVLKLGHGLVLKLNLILES
jgi:hypothetical protein